MATAIGYSEWYTSDGCTKRSFTSYTLNTSTADQYSYTIVGGIEAKSADGKAHSLTVNMLMHYTQGGTTKSGSATVSVPASGTTSKTIVTWNSGTLTKPHTADARKFWCERNGSGTGFRSSEVNFNCPVKTSYTVSYNANYGSGAPGSQVKWYGETLTLTSSKPTRTGYNFSKWFYKNAGDDPVYYNSGASFTENASRTLMALWTQITYSITYSYPIESSPASNPGTYTIESAAFTLKNPTWTGHTFTGWTGTGLSSSTKTVTIAKGSTGNRSYTANFSVNSYTLTFNANGGSVSPASKSVAYGSNYGALPTPTRSGYTFDGWYTAASGGTKVSGSTTMGAANATVHAHWTEKTATLSYNNGGRGTTPSSVTMKYTTATNAASALSATGYTFGGWRRSDTGATVAAGGQVKAANVEPSNVTLTGLWQANSYTIVFDKNTSKATGTMANLSMTYDSAKNLTTNGYARTGYTFKGWATTAARANAGTVDYSNLASVKNLTSTSGATVTLYAVWELIITVYKSTKACRRCDSDGTLNDEGTTGKIECTVTPGSYYDETAGDGAGGTATFLPTQLVITIKDGSTTVATRTISSPGTSVSEVLGTGDLAQNKFYSVTLDFTGSVTDPGTGRTFQQNLTITDTISNTVFLIDVSDNVEGGSIGILGAASDVKHALIVCSDIDVTGTIEWKSEYDRSFGLGLTLDGNSEHTTVDIGWNYTNRDGAYLGLRSVDYSRKPGAFDIGARDGTNSCVLTGKPDGTLSWGGQKILIQPTSDLTAAIKALGWQQDVIE